MVNTCDYSQADGGTDLGDSTKFSWTITPSITFWFPAGTELLVGGLEGGNNNNSKKNNKENAFIYAMLYSKQLISKCLQCISTEE